MNQELERFEPADVTGRLAYEHFHRYAICRDRAASQRVLDVACGVGYGTHMLAQVAAHVTGVDIDPAAIRRAKQRFREENLTFVTADCCEMPFAAGSFDIIVANEMIEHIEDHDALLNEVKRVLIPGGTLLVSTPNKPVYNRYKSPNPFHVSEMDIPEFRQLLKRHFKHVRFTGLRMALVSAAFDIDGAKRASNLVAAKTYRGSSTSKGRPAVSNEELTLDDPEYVLATCSDRLIEDDAVPSTIFFSNDDDLWLEHEKVMAWASRLHEEDEVLRADLRQSRDELEVARSALAEQKRSDEGRQHLTISSRLLSRLTGGQVAADPIAVIEAMFSLNEQIVVQRGRLEILAETQKKLSDLEDKLESSRAAQEQLTRETRRAELRIEELQRDHARTRDDRDRLAQDLFEARSQSDERERLSKELADAQREELERVGERLALAEAQNEELGRESSRLNDEAARSRTEAEDIAARLQHELRQAQSDVDTLRRELDQSKDKSQLSARDAILSNETTKQAKSVKQRKEARLAASRTRILQQMEAAHDAVRGRIVEPIDARRLLKRFTRSRPVGGSILFDREWIVRQVPEAGRISYRRFVRNSDYRRVDPHPLFAAAEYLDRYPDVAESGLSPLDHYLLHGWREGRDPHRFFAGDWYLQQNPDVLNSGLNPLTHYLEHGWKEGRWPNPVFDPAAYLDRHPDVRAEGIEPLTHFVMHGVSEDREVPILGLERDWRALLPHVNADSLMGHLLSDALPFASGLDVPSTASENTSFAETEDTTWPPRPLSDFWIPQAMRDFMVERNWDGLIPLYTYFYSIMDAYAESPVEFVASAACRQIVARAQALSAQRNRQQKPTASVVIPVYNNILDTLLCIVSLLEDEKAESYEIIVADDSSNDATSALIPEIGGVVRHFRQPENRGFLGNCNAAAEHARGETIIFLNNDTLVLPGWLKGLIAPFERFEAVGLVGSKLLSWDGRLQEAGGIFWSDGSAWNFGRGQNPIDPEFNYLKDVDYCSGASIAVPASLWRKLGGFDPIYTPAYCEDSDLAFRIRSEGYRTIYSAESELIHHEGRSHGRDTAVGIKAYQLINQQRFIERWRWVLKNEHFPNGEEVLRARDRSGRKPHILVIDHYVPQVDKDAGSRTMFQFLQSMIDAGWAVTFWPENLFRAPDYTEALQALGVEVIYGVKFVDKFSDFLCDRRGLYDAVLLSRPHVAVNFIEDVRKLTDAQILYYGHDVHFERMKAQRNVADSIDENAVEAMKSLEIALCNRCDVILYPSEEEAHLMSKLVSKKVKSRAIPAYGFDDCDLSLGERAIAGVSSSPDRPAQLLFVGGFSHGPNVDGVVWFCREVAPILRKNGFPFHLQIVGSNPTADVWDLESEDTQVLGYVSDEKLRQCYAEASTVIAPLRFGAGVKGKVVEAMAYGVPVATTHVGAQGLIGADDYLFLGDTPEEFAAAIRASADESAAKSKAGLALDYVRGHYSRAAMTGVLQEVLPSMRTVFKAA